MAARLIFEDLTEEEGAEWDCIEEGDDARGWYQIWETNGQYWRIEYYTSYDDGGVDGIDEDSVTFREVQKKEKVVVFYD